MRICIVYQGGEAAVPERINKTARTLSAAGHQIFLLWNDYDNFPAEEDFGPLHSIRLRPVFGSRTLNRILKFPVFLNPLWIVQLWRVIRRFRIEALHVVDVPLSPAVLAAGRLLGLPVVYDMWENYPEALRGWAKTDWKTLVFKNHHVARWVELAVTPRVDRVITVVKEQRERLIGEGVSPKRVSVVTNGVDTGVFSETTLRRRTPLDEDAASYKLLYVGLLTVERGLEDIIRAIRHLRAEVPAVRLYIAGRGNHEPALRRVVEQEKAEEFVRFLGAVPFAEIPSYIEAADLCLVPHLYNDFINTTMPNKLFQYMALGKPVLVSHAKPLARIVKECGCGFIFESGNPTDAAKKIVQAYQSRADLEIGERGRRCVREKYTWEKVSGELVRIYEQLAASRRASAK